jgi:hypothetical protein
VTEAGWLACEDPAAVLAWLSPDGEASGRAYVGVSDRKLRLFACSCCRLAWDRLPAASPCPRCGPPKWVDPGCPACRGSGRVAGPSRRAVEVAERYADALATDEELGQAWARQIRVSPRGELEAFVAYSSNQPHMDWLSRWNLNAVGEPAAQAALLRDVFGNPWRPVMLPRTFDTEGGQLTTVACCDWLTPDVRALARAAYEEYLPNGLLDPARLAVLADALEDTGCDSEELLRHLRGQGRCRCLAVPCCALGMDEDKNWRDAHTCPLCGGTGYRPLPGPHARGCWALDLIPGEDVRGWAVTCFDCWLWSLAAAAGAVAWWLLTDDDHPDPWGTP